MHLLSIGLDDTLLMDESAARGDAAARQCQYAERLGRLDLIVFTRCNTVLPYKEISPNVAVYATQSSHPLCYVADALHSSTRVQRERGHVDAIAVQDPFLTGIAGYHLKRRWGVGLNVQLFSSFFDNPHWLAEHPGNRLLQILGKFIVRAADTVRVESSTEKKHLVAMGIPDERIWIVPLLYNLERFMDIDGGPVRARYLNGPYDQMVLFVGRLAPEKDLPTLLRAVPTLAQSRPGVRIVIVGKGQEDAGLRQLAQELQLGERVVFAGQVANEDLPAYYAACDVFVLPSIYEGIPTVLVEAATAGRPIVSTRTRNVDDIVVDGQNGYIVPIRDSAALAGALARVLMDPALAVHMGQKGHQIVQQRFTPARVLTDLIAMWEATARSSQGPLRVKA